LCGKLLVVIDVLFPLIEMKLLFDELRKLLLLYSICAMLLLFQIKDNLQIGDGILKCCAIESWEAHSIMMLEFYHRILLLAENSKEVGFYVWVLHHESSSHLNAS